MMTGLTPPTIPGHWLWGNLYNFYSGDLMTLQRETARQYGDVMRLRLMYRTVYMFNHPDDVHQLLVEKHESFIKAPGYRHILARFLGNGLLTSDGDFWKRQRRLAQPAFHHHRIQTYADVMVDYTLRLLVDWEDGAVRDITRDMLRLTLTIVSRLLFNVEMDSANVDRFYHTLTSLLALSEHAFRRPRLMLLPNWLPSRFNHAVSRSVRDLDSIILPIIDERRASGEDKGDLLSMLLLARDADGSSMTDRQIRDEAITFISAGHETTSTALGWTWYLLARHPHVEAKLHAELDMVLAGRAPTLDDMRRLPYTEWVIKESMRLYPPAPLFARQAVEPVQIGRWHVPKGTICLIAPHIMHRDPRWFDQPDTFDPERFSPEREQQRPLPRYAYLPFGGGPRVCIGSSFASMEAVLLLATIAGRWRLRLEQPAREIATDLSVTLRPHDNIRMRIEARQPLPELNSERLPES